MITFLSEFTTEKISKTLFFFNSNFNFNFYIESGHYFTYFQVYGKLANYDGLEKFEWSHTYSRVNSPKGKYNPTGIFMYFDKYNVESRDRVKCLSAIEGKKKIVIMLF